MFGVILGGLLLASAAPQAGPQVVQVGRVTAVYWDGDGGLATALAELADRPHTWPGVGRYVPQGLRLIVARGSVFDSLTRGRVPRWGAGFAFPGTSTIVVKAGAGAQRVLKHELAHLALHSAVKRVPRWFDEGYAAFVSGEWDRLDALRMNLAVLRGAIPELGELDRALRSGATEAEAAYALATTTVLLLNRLGGSRGLEPLIARLSAGEDLDSALRVTYGISLVQFGELWRRDLRSRYGWLVLGTSFAVLWSLVLAVAGVFWRLRRARYQARRKALDEGWALDA